MALSAKLESDDSTFLAGLRQDAAVALRVARRLAPPGDAEDVAQEAMLAAWRYRGSYDSARAPQRAWLLAIVVRESRKAHGRSLRHTELLSRLVTRVRVADAVAVVPQDPMAAAVEAAVARLSRRQREVVELHYYVDLPIEEVGAVLGISTGTVKSTLADARARIRAHVEGAHR